jgi:hypothetical protein
LKQAVDRAGEECALLLKAMNPVEELENAIGRLEKVSFLCFPLFVVCFVIC